MRQRVVTSGSNPIIKRLRSLARSHSRRRSGRFLLEGPKFIFDAASAGIRFKTLIASENYIGPLPETARDTEYLRVSAKLFEQISSTSSPQGLIAEAARRWTALGDMTGTRKHLLAAWNVQDPGNIGTIIRSCAAFGMGGVIVSPGCADPFSPRAVRASAGAVLRLPIAKSATLSELLADLLKAGYTTCWTGVKGEKAIWDSFGAGPFAVFVGSEGQGFDDNQREAIGRGVRVPILPQVESLNAAVVGSLVAYELAGRSL
jgi:TrmH family RNA methyltransferase